MEHMAIFKNTLSQLLARGSTTIVGFFVTILVARYFGAQGYGDYTKIISVVTLFYLVIDFGFNAAYIRDKKVSFSHILYSRIGIAFLLFIFLNIAVFFLPFNVATNTGFSEVVKMGILIFSLSFFTQAIIFSTAGYFQRKQAYQHFMVSQAAGALLNLVLILLIVKFSFSIIFVVSALVISGLFSSVIGLVLTREKPVFSSAIHRDLFVVSLPLAAMLIFNLIYFKIDAVILSFFKSTMDVGIYGFSFRVFEFLIAIPLFMSNSIYPVLTSKLNNKKVFLDFFIKYRVIFLIVSFLLIVIGWFMSPLVSFINNDFSSSILPLRILLISLPLFFMTSIYQWALITFKQQKFLMYVYFLNAVLNIILNIAFIPRYSYIASAAITGFCEGLVAIILIWQFSRIFSERQEER